MHLTECEPTAMSAAVVMDPLGGGAHLQSGGGASLDDVATEPTAIESSGEESASEREEEAVTPEEPAPHPVDTRITSQNTHTQQGEARSPESLALAAPASHLWTTSGEGTVKLRMSDSGLAAEPPITVHQMFSRAVERFGSQTALAWKEGEKWRTLNYKEYYQQCRTAAKSFLKLGLERYHGVGILGFNSVEWFITDIGAILAGGFAVGIYTTNSPEACQYVAENCQANILVVENHKQLQKILQIQDKLPHLKAIIQYKDALKEKRPNVFTWAEFMQMGSEVPDAQLDDIIASQKPNQCCTLIYTSGTTGQPKGVMLSHDNLTWTAFSTARHVGLKDADVAQEVVVSYLPLSHIAAQMIDIWITMKTGGATYFAQPDALKGSLANTLREVRPTAFMGVPRVWEKMQEKMKSVGAKSSAVRKKVAVWAKSVGLQTNLNKMQSRVLAGTPLNYRLAKKLVFCKVRKALGLDRCTKCYTGAAPITKDTLEFFLSLDIPVYELYGMSESSGPHTVSLPDAYRLTSCGKVIPGCETKLFNQDDKGEGEICFWGRHVFMGYLNMPEKTEEALDADGWLHSGDLGKVDPEGFLFITGRIKELIITAGGENIPPVPIEDAVKEAVPLVSNAMLVGDKRKFLTMLLTIKCQVNGETGAPEDELTEEAVELCQKLGSSARRVSEIANGRDRLVVAAIQEGINHVNERATSNAQRIQKWVVLEHDFSIPGGELGPTMKLKRPVVLKMYEEQIENFYNDVVTPTNADNPVLTK
ncbi:long-chain-fatty-acid--CoA ligase ACSBG2-like isoform X1 [Megalops cyprinoides]|uniref:long-chain-fatty-acid--CoA ligase ACSBG2-like isoform X1 n=2 Tax=Megalops cyprinoides TaxID=118141 RepID=UPI001863E465|nr:long-chain-fatty-acid--CoA ligase ACSBG2-like isoform X1 [Megalops cyprinoides]